jgi:integrase
MVDCGAVRVNGKLRRERFFFEFKKNAETKRDLLRIERENQGRAARELEPADREDAKAALLILKPHGASLRDAARFYVENLEVVQQQKTVSDVLEELLDVKAQDGRATKYIRDMRSRLNIFAGSFGEKAIHGVTAREIDDYLRSLSGSAVSRNNSRRLIGVLFSFAVTRRYALKNPVKEVATANVTVNKPGILTLAEAQELMLAAEPKIIPAVALGLFAGLRPESEVWRLDWRSVDLDERSIDVSKSKNVASHRFVKISDNLLAWLRPYAKAHGPVSPRERGYYRRVEAARVKAAEKLATQGIDANNLRTWPSDCLRHSYASYHYGLHKDAHETAEQLGHGGSLTMFYRHYRNRVKEPDATAYWEIRPEAWSSTGKK